MTCSGTPLWSRHQRMESWPDMMHVLPFQTVWQMTAQLRVPSGMETLVTRVFSSVLSADKWNTVGGLSIKVLPGDRSYY